MDRKPVDEVKTEVIHIRVKNKKKKELQDVAEYLGITISGVGSIAVSEYLNNHDELRKIIKS